MNFECGCSEFNFRTVPKKWEPSRQSCLPTLFITPESLLVALVAAIVNLFFNPEAVRIVFFLSAPVCFSDTFPAISNAIGETLQVRISWDEYRDKIVDYGHIKIFAMASVQETKQSWSEEDDFQLEKPKLDVQV